MANLGIGVGSLGQAWLIWDIYSVGMGVTDLGKVGLNLMLGLSNLETG
jgi:hypothetical protein